MPTMTAQDRWERDELVRLLYELVDYVDGTPGRGDVNGLEHSLQTADRARKAGADSELVLVALLHDAAKPLSETTHGLVIAEMLRSRVSARAWCFLAVHGDAEWDRVGLAESDDLKRLAGWDAASFDPDYPTPPLEEFLPLIDKLYSNEYVPLP